MCIPSGDGLKQLAARIMGCSSGGQAQRLLAAAFHRAGSYTGHKSHWTQRSRQPANCFIDSTEANLLSVRGGGKKRPLTSGSLLARKQSDKYLFRLVISLIVSLFICVDSHAASVMIHSFRH